ncbi:hypothetical protein DPMN_162880 [Dreissena polymorpha]|uniref:Uncharacterized protein n=1 Tax=Dreissena polymorpha TaxID=45954 RepID=A0A9D4EQ66_DREPO|nr:hypothetical protein DPMN_162880 [Dreissena polymorpha]
MQGRDYTTLADRGPMENHYDHLADLDVHASQYYENDEIVRETSLQTNVPQYRAPLSAPTMVT